MRLCLVLFVLSTMLLAPAAAQTPTPSAHHSAAPAPHKTPFMSFGRPSSGATAGPMSAQGCNTGRMQSASKAYVNPVTGVHSNQVVSIPIGGGSVQKSTTHSQQAAACAQGH
jgi:hypothetical protein